MTYRVIFSDDARKEWNKLGATVRQQFGKVLRRRAEAPHVPAARLGGLPNLYKIKLRGAGFRLVYEVRDNVLVVFVIGIGRRDEVYPELRRRLERGFDD